METPEAEFERRVAQLNGLTPMATVHEERDAQTGTIKWSVTPYFIVEYPSSNIYVRHDKLYDSEQEAVDAGHLDRAGRCRKTRAR